VIKLACGLIVAILVGVGCRWFGIPLPGPPAIMGAAMAVAMACGYTATDYLITQKRAVPQTVAVTTSVARQNAPWSP
jgi:XapX domain-containing protein